MAPTSVLAYDSAMSPSADLFDSWVAKLRQRNQGKSKFNSKSSSIVSSLGKQYLHLDLSVSAENPEDWKCLISKEAVRKRAFYPFLRTVKSNKRYQKVDGKRRKHPDGPKERGICCAAHHDSLVYSWYSFLLEQAFENRIKTSVLDECILAYRAKGKNNLHFSKEVFDYISQTEECVSIATDVTGFFDNLDHKILKYAWKDFLGEPVLPPDHYNVFKAMTRFRWLEEEEMVTALGEKEYAKRTRRRRITHPAVFRQKLVPIQKTNTKKCGIPQGAPLSAVLSNLYMYELDMKMQQFAAQCNGIYRRYSDDLLLIVPKAFSEAAEEFTVECLQQRELSVNPKKTEIRYFQRADTGVLSCLSKTGIPASMQYLGLEFNGRVIRIRSASLAKYHHRLRRSVHKTVRRSLTHNKKGRGKVFKRALYSRYTHLGQSNFISYTKRAAKITGSQAIIRQLGNTISRVNQQVSRELSRFNDPQYLVRRVKSKNYRKIPKAA